MEKVRCEIKGKGDGELTLLNMIELNHARYKNRNYLRSSFFYTVNHFYPYAWQRAQELTDY